MRAFLFDRDGTLNIDTEYINNPDDMSLYPSVPDVLKEIKSKNYNIFIITNQSGIGRGLIKPAEYRDVNEKFISLIGDSIVDEILFCPHSPILECGCRKPKTLLLEILKENYNINCSESFFVGDKYTDIICGKNFGFRTVLIINDDKSYQQSLEDEIKPDIVINSISEIVNFIR